MSCWALYDLATGAIDQIVLDDPTASLAEGVGAKLFADVPNQSSWQWDAAVLDFVPRVAPRWFTGLQILALYTSAQHVRARRLLFATFPDGHPWAGQMVDPDGVIQRLLDATLALKEPISTASEFHIQGTAIMRAAGVIESDEEAVRIAAGITPEEAALLAMAEEDQAE